MSGEAGVIDAPETHDGPSPGGSARGDVLPDPAPDRHRPHTVLVATLASVGLVVLALAAGVAWSRMGHSAPKPAAPVAAGPLFAVDPPAGARGVRPEAKVSVTANRGRLSEVRVVDGGGRELAGTLAPFGRTWESTARLALDAHYTVTAHIAGIKRRPVVRTSEFSTVHPVGFLSPTVTPADHSTVGVGMPIVVRFKSPVADRNAVTQGLLVSMSKPVDGAWHWFSPREVHYRPREYWPVGEQVTVATKLVDVDAGNDIWGDVDRTVTFTVGERHIATVDTDAHTMTVTSDGTVVRTVPQSSGREKYPTMGGIHVVLDKAQHVVMDSSTVGIPVNSPDGYREDVYWNVAITNGGEYVHAAPWSTGAQGNRNVSHGCVNLSTADARWFYGFSRPGDLVEVVGTGRQPSTTDAGTADWNVPWEQWVQPIA
jgi:lipoprotein-anchoring transpeptidase ErfK/SrfK